MGQPCNDAVAPREVGSQWRSAEWVLAQHHAPLDNAVRQIAVLLGVYAVQAGADNGNRCQLAVDSAV